jgi:protoheme IX farnesyltransferase
MQTRADLLDRPRDLTRAVRAVVELSKPGVTRLVLVTTACGAWAAPGPLDPLLLALAVFGTGLVVAGANALNMVLEVDSDAFMTRTRGRPLPTGRLSTDEALVFGVGVSIAGLALLAHFVSMAAVALAALALLSYVLVYTPLKRVTSAALYVGAVPGALPPAIGYAAVTGTLDRIALLLFAILFVWQLPHFIAISVFRRDEYARAGLKVVPMTWGLRAAKVHIVVLSVVLWAVTLLPWFLELTGHTYGLLAAVSGGAFLVWALRGLKNDADHAWARSLFLASMPHLVLVMAALVLSVA